MSAGSASGTGRMGLMPRRPAVPDLTGEPAAAHRAIQNESRLSCLRFLLRDGPATRAQITAATGLSVSTTIESLRELESLGYIAGSLDGDDRAGRHPLYTAQREKITTELLAFVSWVLR